MTPEEATERFFREYQVDGIAFTRHDAGLYWTDDDNALYTGVMLGAMCYRYAADPRPENLDNVRALLRGVSLLTLVTGERGVLVRRAMPEEISYKFGLDDMADKGNYWYDKPLELHRGYYFQLKTTRDQITGILFGLACAHKLLNGVDPQIDEAVQRIVMDLHNAISYRGYSVKDHRNRTHGTSAHKLDAPLRLLLDALAVAVAPGTRDKPSESFFRNIHWFTWHYNTRIQNAYSHGLNAMTAHALGLIEAHHLDGHGVRQWMIKIEDVIAHEHNPFWEMLLGFDMTHEGVARWAESGTDPYTKFFKWNRYQREIKERHDTSGPMIDYLIVSYMDAYYNPGDQT